MGEKHRNGWAVSNGIGGRIKTESLGGLERNMHTENNKQTIIHLLDILTTDKNPHYNRLDPRLKLALFSLKVITTGTGTQKDHDNIVKYALQLQKTNNPKPIADNTHVLWNGNKILLESSNVEENQQPFEGLKP